MKLKATFLCYLMWSFLIIQRQWSYILKTENCVDAATYKNVYKGKYFCTSLYFWCFLCVIFDSSDVNFKSKCFTGLKGDKKKSVLVWNIFLVPPKKNFFSLHFNGLLVDKGYSSIWWASLQSESELLCWHNMLCEVFKIWSFSNLYMNSEFNWTTGETRIWAK